MAPVRATVTALLVTGLLSACSATASAPSLDERVGEDLGTGPPSLRAPDGDARGHEGRPSASVGGSTVGDGTGPTGTRDDGIRQVTMAFTGDTLTHSPLWAQAQRNAGGNGYDYTPMQARLTPLLDGVDLAVCHLETPIAPDGEEFSTAPAYGVQPEVVAGLAANGYDRCSTASNHTFDRGIAGIDRTVNVLAYNGLGQSGMARTPQESSPQVFEVNGVKISHLSYTFGYNGNIPPPGQEWRSTLIDPARIIGDAVTARSRGAEVVVASLHWGDEGVAAPTDAQRSVAEAITADGAIDLVVGHHAHVLQPTEKVNGTWVMFGLGNIISNLPDHPRWPAAAQDAAVATTTVTIDRAGKVRVARPVMHPTWVDRDHGWVVRVVQADLADPSTPPDIREQLRLSLDRTRMVLDPFIAKTP